MCVAGNYKEPKSSHHQHCITHKPNDANIKSNLSLNNKNGFVSVTNNQIHLIHHITDNLCKHNQTESSRSVPKCFGKNNLNFKNNKNLIYSQNLSKSDMKYLRDDETAANKDFDTLESCENKLNGINQLKSVFHAKRFIMTNVADLLNFKLKIAKQDDCIEPSDPKSDDKPLSAFESAPNNLICQKLDGHSKPISIEHTKRFTKNHSPHSVNESSSDFSPTIKINYASRQFSGLTNGYVTSNSHAKNENNFHDGSSHERTENATNEKSIPNIVINGNATDLNDKMVNGAANQAKSSIGKLLLSHRTICKLSHVNFSDFFEAFFELFLSFFKLKFQV